MALKLVEQKKNPLLKREEAWLLAEHSGAPTPTRKDIIKEAAKTLKAKEELVIVDKIFSEKGMGASKVKVLVYAKKEDIPKILAEKMERRMKTKEGAEGEAPAEEKKEESAPEGGEEKKEEGKEAPKEEKAEGGEKPAEEKKEESAPEGGEEKKEEGKEETPEGKE